MASRWNLWVWLECISVVRGFCCKEVERYPHNYYVFLYTPLVLALFLAAASILLCSFFYILYIYSFSCALYSWLLPIFSNYSITIIHATAVMQISLTYSEV